MFIGVFENQKPRTKLLFHTNHGYNTCEPGEPRSSLKRMCDNMMPRTRLALFHIGLSMIILRVSQETLGVC